MKYVVKMDYCTMAFTSGTCSLQALSNCLAGDTDLHWVQIYNSEKSPYHSPLGLLFQAALLGQPMVYDSVFRVRFRGFRRFYDFFLRRKHLESLVRVIRPFGVHLCATRAKNFRLDIFVRRIIMKIERDAAVSAVSPQKSTQVYLC